MSNADDIEESWDFYFTNIDGKPASISLDFAFRERAPLADHPQLIVIRVAMRSPLDNGLSSRDEAPALAALEDAVNEALYQSADALQVGRVTRGGFRDLFFYARSHISFEDALEKTTQHHPDYRLQFRSEDEPGWSTYKEFLLPDPAEQRWMSDREVVSALRDEGDKNELPRPVDHFIFLPSRDAATRLAADLKLHGFRVQSIDDIEDGSAHLQITREDPVTLAHIHEVASGLFELALRAGGRYDGWESPVTFAH